ncbi:succinate dehydrogenase cytochrome b subunit [Ilumatobacter sp.]|uniref:succinate dehydrogenase cytochrome b subunit n=1 Tax=Ilumatobacter sp. TaxID=1967498 RepID=UPI003C67F3D7
MAQTLSRGPVSGTAVKAPAKKKPFILDLYATAVGKKYVMAITGLIGLGFVITHMIGNLKVFLGLVTEGNGDRIYDVDVYGEFLRDLAVPLLPRTWLLWGLRLVLIAAVLLHIHAAYGLTKINHHARAVKYQSARDYQVANFASRTMRYTGIIVGLFIIWHLADLTWGVTGTWERGEVYYNVDQSLSRIPVAALYIVANIALGIHLFHGVWSLFQSMGWNNPRFNAWRRNIAVACAAAIVVGNVSIPVAVLAGVVEYDPAAVTHPVGEDSE